jgi:hypothetical protein
MSNLAHDTRATADTAEKIVNNDEGSSMEHRTRKERKFPEVESGLPDIKMTPAVDHRPSLAVRLLSYLGPYNPIPQQISANDEVWLFDNTAYRSADNSRWQAEFVAAVFDKKTGQEVSSVFADVAEKVGVGKGDAAEAIIRERLIPFVQAVLPARVVRVNCASRRELKLGPGGRNGISSDTKGPPAFTDGEIVPSAAKVPEGTSGMLKMNTVFAEPEGWGLISGKSIPRKPYGYANHIV